MDESFWKRCATCKTPIGFAADYYVCSVTTCNRPRTALAFCTIGCWDSHVPIVRHRDAWAEEKTSPTREEWERERAAEDEPSSRPSSAAPAAPAQRAAAPAPGGPTSIGSQPARTASPGAADESRPEPVTLAAGAPVEILVVASKLKAYVRARSGMNTSDAVLDVLSDKLRSLCDQAIRRAAEAGRKTVLDRDF